MCVYLKKLKVFPAFKQQLSLLFTQPYNVHLSDSLFNYGDNYELFSLVVHVSKWLVRSFSRFVKQQSDFMFVLI